MYMNKLYEEGLLDKETFTQDAQAVTARKAKKCDLDYLWMQEHF